MRNGARYRRWGIGLAGLLCLCLPARAQPLAARSGAIPVQVFSKVNRSVVAVGVAFTVEVEVLASPLSLEAAVRVERALMAASYAVEEEELELIREESSVSGFQSGGAPLVLLRRFILRARRSGSVHLPPLRFSVDGREYAAPPQQVTAYEVAPGFMRVGEAVLPIVAERGEVPGGQPGYVRVGSAFLIAPDALVTSLHVVIDARRIWVRLPDGKRVATRKAWAVDPVRDVAILHVNPKHIERAGLTPLRLAADPESVPPSPREREAAVAFTYGWPGGTQRSTAGLRYHDLTLQPGERLWISTNPVRAGDSGGPLLDRYGRVLGVVSSGTVDGDRPDALSQEVCIAADVRPSLAHMLVRSRPRSLRALLRAPAYDAHPFVHALRLTTMLSMGQQRARASEFKASLARLNATLEDGNAHLLFLHGVIYQMLGTRRRAAASYRASLKAFDGNFLSSYMLAQHHLRRREYRQAERLFRHTLQYEPYAYFAAYGLARALMGRLRYREAVPLLRAVIAHDPDFASAYYDLALSTLALGDEPLARQLQAKLEDLSPIKARQLRRVLHEPLLQPYVLRELPRASFSSLYP